MDGGELGLSTQKKILSLLDTELNTLVNSYEERIKSYEDQILLLQFRVDELMMENKLYQAQLVLSKPSQPQKDADEIEVLKIDQNRQEITYDQMDELCMSASVENSVLLLEACKQSLVDFDIDKLTYGFDSIISNSKILMHDTEEVSKRFLDLVEIILLDDKLSEQAYDVLISSLLNLLIEMESAPFREKTIDLLKLKNEKIFDYILVRNEPRIITKYLRMLLVYGMKEHVETALVHLLDIEWGFIDSSLSKEDFTFFLWYTYLFDLDGELIDQSSISLRWFNEEITDQALYFYCKDELNKNWADYSDEIEQFNNGNVLTKFEKDLIIQKLKRKIKPRHSKSEKSQLFTRTLNSVTEKDLPYFIDKYNLVKQKVTIPLYKNKKGFKILQYIEVDNIYFSPAKLEAFIIQEELAKINREYSTLFIKSRSFNGVIHSDMARTNSPSDPFSWPSTEVAKVKSELNNTEESTLNEKSELIKLGYQISGNTRVSRWAILEKAVPKIGLKKIAYTISYNVKLRKGQKNGIKKFHHAITEWEHDLAKLKKHYYNNQFNWPKS